MTDSTQPETPFEGGQPIEQPEIPGAEAVVTPPKKRAPRKAATAKTASTPEKPAEGAIYLPTLPKGYTYVGLAVRGPDDTRLVVDVTSLEGGGEKTYLTVAADIERTMDYPSFPAAVKAAADTAKLLVKRAARKAELAALDAEFGE